MKLIAVIACIAFGLVAMAHGPADALGDFAESFSCLAGMAAMNADDLSKSEVSLEASHVRLIKRTRNLPLVAIATSRFSRSMRCPTIPRIQQITQDAELVRLLAKWQFLRRAALAPRAPSILV